MSKRYRSSSYDIDEEYFLWLCGLVDAEDPDAGYLGIMNHLYDTEFSDRTAKLIPNDDNRIEDGLYLREDFYRENPYCDEIDRPCSVLEMMIALANRIEEQFGYEDSIFWFWEMMRNLDLERFDDTLYYSSDGRDRVDNILSDFLDRKYSKDGFGGLFPIYNSPNDQRKVEIWTQMNNYLVNQYM